MLDIDHNLPALGRREFEGPDPEHDDTQAERADERWQVQTFDPLCDGYGNIHYGHPFVLRLDGLFSLVAVRDCRFIHGVILVGVFRIAWR